MPPQPPRILQVVREPLRPGVEAEYDRIESEIARECARLRCPHPYLGLESLTGPKEVWWFNGYDSAADQKQVAEAWAKNKEALATLGRIGQRKARLTDKAIEVFAYYRRDLSIGKRFVIVPVRTRDEAAAAAARAGPETRVFAVRPSWSHPAEDWIASDPEFWRPGNRR